MSFPIDWYVLGGITVLAVVVVLAVSIVGAASRKAPAPAELPTSEERWVDDPITLGATLLAAARARADFDEACQTIAQMRLRHTREKLVIAEHFGITPLELARVLEQAVTVPHPGAPKPAGASPYG
ncbi:MAG: hypothetical protein AB7H43_15665 [Acidimicrobiia bacterium]